MFSGFMSVRRSERSNRARPRRNRYGRERKVFFEVLEDRRLLANVLWIASSSGTWSTPANWIDLSNGTNHVPAGGDVAVFDTTQSYGATAGTNSNATINATSSVAGMSIANYTGTITQNATRNLTVGASGYSQASGTFLGGALLDVNGNFTLSGGNFTAPGSSSFSVAGNFSVSGGTFTHNSGTVTFDAGSGTQTLDSGGATFHAVTHSGAGALQLVANDLTTAGTFTNSNGRFDVNGRACNLNTLILSNGTIEDTSATPGQITSPSAYDLRNGSVSAKLAGGMGLNKTTGGTVTLSGANAYTGATQVQGGTLRIENNNALGTTAGTTSVSSGATLEIRGDGLSVGENLTSLAGTLRNTCVTCLPQTNPAFVATVWSGQITLAAGSNIDVVPNSSSTLNVTGQVSESVVRTLTKTGSGMLVLSNATNNYTGGTTISAGWLRVGVPGAIPDNTVTVNGYLDLYGNSEGIGALEGSSSGRVMSTAVGTATLTIGLDNGDGNFLGNIQDGTSDPAHKLALTKTGTGTQTLGGAGAGSDNSYTGQTFVENGTLALNKTPPAYPNVRIAVSSHVVIVGDGTNAAVLKLLQRDQISEFADVEVRAGATFLLNGNNETFDTLNGVGLVTNNSDTGATLTLGYDGDFPGSFLGVMQDGTGAGRLSLTKMGDGIQSLGGSSPNTFTGTTTVTGGTLVLNKTPGINALGGNITIGDTHDTDTLQLGASNQIPDNVTVTFTSGTVGDNGVFDLNGHDETVGKLISIGDRYHRITNTAVGTSTLTVNAAGGNDSTFTGRITNGDETEPREDQVELVALTKTGTGTLTLSGTGTNTYSGETDIQEGILALAAASVNNIDRSELITVRDGAVLDVMGLNGNTIVLADFTDSPGLPAGQTLQGHGEVNGQVDAGPDSTVSPGIFPAPPGTDPGDLDTDGAAFQAASTFLVDIEGREAGKEYDQLLVEGEVTIQAGAVLQTPGTFVPSIGDVFIIIDNRPEGEDDPVRLLDPEGRGFNNLREGEIYDSNFRGTGLQAIISYRGGDGNDVVIRFVGCAIGDLVWRDDNGDGIQNDGDTGINGVVVDLLKSTGELFATTKTINNPVGGAPGYYQFSDLPLGSYTVAIHASNFADGGALFGYTATPSNAPGSTPANDSNDSPATVILTAQDVETIDFGFYRLVTIGDWVWEDLNGNGIQDDGATGISGVTVTLSGRDGLGNLVSVSTTSEVGGVYRFTEPPGKYTVSVQTPLGYVATATGRGTEGTDSNGSPSETTPAVLASGEVDGTIDFGFYQPVTIGDYVWEDLNGNGIQDDGATGISGVTVDLSGTDGLGNTVTARATSDAEGRYSFTVAPGSYWVEFSALAGYHFSPALQGADRRRDSDGPRSGQFTLSSRQRDVTIDAGLVQLIVLGPDKNPGTLQEVRVAALGRGESTLLWHFEAYPEDNYVGGTRVAVADMDDDGMDEIITAPGRSFDLGPAIRVRSLQGDAVRGFPDFLAYAPTFIGGVHLAVAYVNEDQLPDIITVPSYGAAVVRVFLNRYGKDPGDPYAPAFRGYPEDPDIEFTAFAEAALGGAVVAAADVGSRVKGVFENTLDGKAEIMVGTGGGVTATVAVFEVAGGPPLQVQSFQPFRVVDPDFSGGVSLDVARIDDNDTPDVIVGMGVNGISRIEVWAWPAAPGAELFLLGAIRDAFKGPSRNAPVRVAAASADGDGIARAILAVQGPIGTTGEIHRFDIVDGSPFQYPPPDPLTGFSGPWFIATSKDVPSRALPPSPLVAVPACVWTNPANPLDVTDEGVVTPLDALVTISFINTRPGDTSLPAQQFSPPHYFDTSVDGAITPEDVLLVVNDLNRSADEEGEGERDEAIRGLVALQDLPQRTGLGREVDVADAAADFHRQGNAGQRDSRSFPSPTLDSLARRWATSAIPATAWRGATAARKSPPVSDTCASWLDDFESLDLESVLDEIAVEVAAG